MENYSYLYRQDDPRVAKIRYGAFRLRVEYNGCGLAALYNIMLRIGQPQPFEALVSEAKELHMPWLCGLCGTKPRSLGRYLSRHGVSFEQTDDCGYFRSALAEHDSAIICAWNNRRRDGIHFFAVFNDGGRLTALNRYDGDDRPTAFSPGDIRENRFITGYLFGRANSGNI